MELGVVGVFILTLPFLFNIAQSIRFQIESGHAKCISEEIKSESITVGNYSVVNPYQGQGYPLPEHHKISVRVLTEKGTRYHNADAVEAGQFDFWTMEDGNHLACFTTIAHQPPENITIEFDWRSGVATKDWSYVAKKGSVDAMQLELMKLEQPIRLIHEEMFYLRRMERETQRLNRITNSMMGYLTLVSLFLCLSVAGLQLWHLKSFFQKNKIL